jgi:hypothetical protein
MKLKTLPKLTKFGYSIEHSIGVDGQKHWFIFEVLEAKEKNCLTTSKRLLDSDDPAWVAVHPKTVGVALDDSPIALSSLGSSASLALGNLMGLNHK